MKCNLSVLKKEGGATLVETLVAMAILVSVLLPTSLFLGYVAFTPHNKEKIVALSIAQSEMETLLAEKKYLSDKKVVNDRWVIENRIESSGNFIQLKVSVYRKNKPKPIVILKTERLLYE